jgi:hypothetical protein
MFYGIDHTDDGRVYRAARLTGCGGRCGPALAHDNYRIPNASVNGVQRQQLGSRFGALKINLADYQDAAAFIPIILLGRPHIAYYSSKHHTSTPMVAG